MSDTSIQNELIVQSTALLSAVRQKKPRIHCITNAAAQVFTANLLLAAGAIPSLTIAAEEVPHFTRRASALLINLGTLDAERRVAIPAALATVRETGQPWVLDPVFVDASPPRFELARTLIGRKPDIIRCNEAEFEILSSRSASPDTLALLSRHHGCVVAMTGPIDRVADYERTIAIANGHPLMSQTTAMGCAGTALIAAFAALTDDRFIATAAALLVLGVTGELAAQDARGPGSFVAAFLDRLAALDARELSTHARIST